MKKVIFTKGLIASGKTTWAKEFVKENQNYKRISRDDIRHMLSSYTFDDINEKLVTLIEKEIVLKCLQKNYNIIIDAQHLNLKYIEEWKAFITDGGDNPDVVFEIKEFPITLAEAIERDKNRAFSIGEKVIKSTWRKYEITLKAMIENNKPKYEWNGDLPYCIISDLDGTLSNSYQRRIFDYKECVNDELIYPVWSILNSYKDNVKIVLLSGREEICREETEEWLRLKNIPYTYLYMRKEKDYRPDTEVKRELFAEHIRGKYQPLFVIDDRPSVCKMWVDLGLFVFNVNQDPLCKNNF